MVEVVCEKTGLVFEAKTRRTKSHPTVMAWLNQAYEEGWYAEAQHPLYGDTKKQFSSIDEFVAFYKNLREKTLHAKHAEQQEKSRRQREQEEASRQRYILNKLLRDRGYNWVNLGYLDDEEIDNSITVPLPKYDWHLTSPDNRLVTMKEAMLELAYQDVKFAKEWLAEHGIAEEVPAIEKQRQQEAAAKQAVEEEAHRMEQERMKEEQERLEHKQVIKQCLLDNDIDEQKAEQEAERLSQPHAARDGQTALQEIRLSEDESLFLVVDNDAFYRAYLDDGINQRFLTLTEVVRLVDALSAQREKLQTWLDWNHVRNQVIE